MIRLSIFAGCLAASLLAQTTGDLGIFEGQSDVGNPALKGSGTFDPARKEYRVTGSGANIWAKADEFHFVWRRLTGDVAISATLRFAEAGGAGHRKIGLMIRQGLAADAPYVDAMVHGDGLTALQFRETTGDITRSFRFPVVAPTRIKLERRGPLFTLWTSRDGQPLQEAGAVPMKLSDPMYVGLVVGSHNAKVIETAVFSDISLESLPKAAPALPLLGLAHAGIRVSDLEKARAFYHGVAGFDEAFDSKDPQGAISAAYFKVNDRQFIEILPGLKPDDMIPMTHIAMYTDNLERLHKMMQDRGVSSTDIQNWSFSIRNLPGQSLGFLEFVQYMPDSPPVRSVGKSLSDRRISRRLEHAGIVTTDLDAALKFYVNTLGFRETWRRGNPDTGKVALVHLRMPGPSGDYVELSNQSGNPNLTRARAGTAAHISLEVPDIKAAYQQTLDRGMTEDRKPPRFGLDERWQFNLFDPDGTRVEFMQPRDPAKAGTPVPNR